MGTYVDLHTPTCALWFPFHDPSDVLYGLRETTDPIVIAGDAPGAALDVLNLRGLRRWTLYDLTVWPDRQRAREILCLELQWDDQGVPRLCHLDEAQARDQFEGQ